MSWSTVVKNILTFVNVLRQAETDTVAQWDDRCLTNAVNWAKYCQKIAEQSQGKSYCADLDRQLESLTLLLNPVTLRCINTDQLSAAVYLLQQTLLSNPATPECILEKVLISVTCSDEDIQTFVELTSGTWVTNRHHLIVQKLANSLGGDKLAQKISVTSEACTILHTLNRLLLKTSHSNRHRFKRYLEKLLKEIVSHTNGWTVLTQMISEAHTCSDVDTSVLEDIVKQIYNWIIENDHFNSGLWKLTPRLLCTLTSGHSELFDLYIGHLVAWGDSMEPVYGLQSTGELYTWRYHCKHKDTEQDTNMAAYSYDVLLGHIQTLLNTDCKGTQACQRILTDQSKMSHFNIWRDILLACKQGKV